MAAGALATGIGLAAHGSDPDLLVRRYRSMLATSRATHDAERSRICAERLTRLRPGDPASLHDLAGVLREQGDPDSADALLVRAAPEDRDGHPPAHLERARALLAAAPEDPAILSRVEAHLRRALAGSGRGSEAGLVLAAVCLRTGKPAEAERSLIPLATQHPEALIPLAEACALQGRPEDSRNWARRALEQHQRASRANPSDPRPRLQVAAAALLLGDHAAAESILRTGLATGDEPALRHALARVYLAWSDSPATDPAARSGCLAKGLVLEPTDPILINRLSSLLAGDAATASVARAELHRLASEGRATAAAHFLLGGDAWRRGDPAGARRHWELAYRDAPELPGLANNLAWSLATGPGADPPRALVIVEAARRSAPGFASLRGTRGHILVTLRRHAEAVEDLMAALASDAGDPDAHRDLASAYAALGNPEKAAEHARQARPVDPAAGDAFPQHGDPGPEAAASPDSPQTGP